MKRWILYPYRTLRHILRGFALYNIAYLHRCLFPSHFHDESINAHGVQAGKKYQHILTVDFCHGGRDLLFRQTGRLCLRLLLLKK